MRNRVPRRGFLVLGALAPLVACSGTATELPPTEFSPQKDTLGPLEFQALVDSPGTVVLDVRTPQEYAAGHLEGAINIDLESGTFAQDIDSLEREVPYALYCRSGERSQTAMDLMVSAGFGQVAHLEGGFEAWRSAGLPTVK